MASTPRRDSYDAVVVGAGLSGLTAAALLARTGRRVLAVERQDGAGGFARAFRRGPYTFDAAVHFIPEAGDGRFVDLVLRFLGVRRECRFLPCAHLWRVDMPDGSVVVPPGAGPAADAHAGLAAGAEEDFHGFYDHVGRFFAEATHIGMRLSLAELQEALPRYPTFFHRRNATLQQVLDEHFADPRAAALAGAAWPYFGLPPSRLAFHPFAQALATLLNDGCHTCEGSFQRLADALGHGLLRAGGELLDRTQVDRIVVERGRARGVRLAGGGEVRASVVVSTASPLETFSRLIDADAVPTAMHRRMNRMTPSVSAFVVYAATTLDVTRFGLAHECFLYRHWDHDETYRDVLEARPGGMWASFPTLADPTIAPAGEHLVIMTSLAPYAPPAGWSRLARRWERDMLELLEEKLLPGLGGRLTHVESATPETLERATRSQAGAAYGWALTPAQVGSRRLPHQTPVEGLYLSGQWTHEGPGSFRAILSGVQTAAAVLGPAEGPQALAGLRPAGMPARIGGP